MTIFEVEIAMVADESKDHAECQQFGIFGVDVLHRPVLNAQHKILTLLVHGEPELSEPISHGKIGCSVF